MKINLYESYCYLLAGGLRWALHAAPSLRRLESGDAPYAIAAFCMEGGPSVVTTAQAIRSHFSLRDDCASGWFGAGGDDYEPPYRLPADLNLGQAPYCNVDLIDVRG